MWVSLRSPAWDFLFVSFDTLIKKTRPFPEGFWTGLKGLNTESVVGWEALKPQVTGFKKGDNGRHSSLGSTLGLAKSRAQKDNFRNDGHVAH